MKLSNIENAIHEASSPAIIAFLTAGYPSKEIFLDLLIKISKVVDVIEIGVPFTDPFADGLTIQRASHTALSNGVSVKWIIEEVERLKGSIECPIALMSYLNPLLAYGFDKLALDSEKAGISGFIVPDLPIEESAALKKNLRQKNIDLIQLVSPATPNERLISLCEASSGFIYAVTKTGVTGGENDLPENIIQYLKNVKIYSKTPICAGFGIRTKEQIQKLTPYIDGVILGSAIIDGIDNGIDIVNFLESLKK
jgi:tryptophan synthase alpha chain